MAIGKKTGGRRKGSLNKVNRTVAEILDSMDCCPIRGMAEIAMDESNDLAIRGRMLAELAQYRYPKLKSLELSGPAGSAIEINVSPAELLARRIDSLAARVRQEANPSGPDRPTS